MLGSKTRATTLLAAIAISALCGCQSQTYERRASSSNAVAEGFAERGIVEIGVLAVRAPQNVAPDVAADLRRAAHDYARLQKRYSTVRFEVLDGDDGPDLAEDPETTRTRAGVDAVLLIIFTRVDRRELGATGRIWSSGEFKLLGPDGTELWRNSFEDQEELVRFGSNPGTWDEQTFEALRSQLLNRLAQMPLKPPLAER